MPSWIQFQSRIKFVFAYLLVFAGVFTGCRVDPNSIPRRYLEDDHRANYIRIFREAPAPEVRVVNSVIIDYASRPGYVTTDDFEFELIVPLQWIQLQKKRFGLEKVASEDRARFEIEFGARKEKPIRSWYAPESLDRYDLYRDRMTSVGYWQLLARKEAETDGGYRVFFSKR